VALVMDGNSRWAAARGLPPEDGHKAGAVALRNAVACCRRRVPRPCVRAAACACACGSGRCGAARGREGRACCARSRAHDASCAFFGGRVFADGARACAGGACAR
jgi:hypothetical protein